MQWRLLYAENFPYQDHIWNFSHTTDKPHSWQVTCDLTKKAAFQRDNYFEFHRLLFLHTHNSTSSTRTVIAGVHQYPHLTGITTNCQFTLHFNKLICYNNHNRNSQSG